MKSRGRNLHWMNIEMSELDLKKLINHFGQSNKAEGKSPKTISRNSLITSASQTRRRVNLQRPFPGMGRCSMTSSGISKRPVTS
jgi:hypothetical protein